MSVFTRLRKSLRLDSAHADVVGDRPGSPGSFHSGNVKDNFNLTFNLNEKGPLEEAMPPPLPNWLQSQYVLPGDKHQRRLGNSASVSMDMVGDDDDQSADVLYISASESPRRIPQSSNIHNSTKRPNSLVSPAYSTSTTTSGRPQLTTASASSYSNSSPASTSGSGMLVTRKRSATVQGHGHELQSHVS
jgi:hypothetical protein